MIKKLSVSYRVVLTVLLTMAILVVPLTAVYASDIVPVVPTTAEEGPAIFFSLPADNGLTSPRPEVSISDAPADSIAQPGTGEVVEPLTAGSLSPGASTTFDTQTIGAGSVVTIAATWTPTSSNLNVGLYSSSGTFYYQTLSEGSGSASFRVNTTGTYAIYVGNPSPSTVRFNVNYVIN